MIVISSLITDHSVRKERKMVNVNEVARKELSGYLNYECYIKIQSQLKIKEIEKN